MDWSSFSSLSESDRKFIPAGSTLILSTLIAFFSVFTLIEWLIQPGATLFGFSEGIFWYQLELWDYYSLIPALLIVNGFSLILPHFFPTYRRTVFSLFQVVIPPLLIVYYSVWSEFAFSTGLLVAILFCGLYIALLWGLGNRSIQSFLNQPDLQQGKIWISGGLLLLFILWKEIYALHFDLHYIQYFTNRSYQLLTLSGLGLLLITPGYLFPPFIRRIYFALIGLIFSITYLGDVLHYRFFGTFSRVSNWQGLFLMMDYRESLWELLKAGDLLYIVDLPFWMFWAFFPRQTSSRDQQNPLQMLPLVLSILFLFPAGIFAVQFLNGNLRLRAGTIDDQFVHVVSLPGFHLLDLGKELFYQESKATRSDIRKIRNFFSRRNGPTRSEWHGQAWGKNVIFLIMESVESFALEATVQGEPVMPNLKEFRQEAELRANLFDITGTGRSGDAKFAALNGMVPFEHQATPLVTADHEFLALPEILAGHGYHTHSLSGSSASQWKSKQTFRKYGFNNRKFLRDWPLSNQYEASLPDKIFFSTAADYLASREEPFFSMVVSSTSHHPYRLPLHMQSLPGGKYQGTIVGDYYQSMRYLDDSFGRFLSELEKAGLRENSIIVIMGDHDAGLPGAVRKQLLEDFKLPLMQFERVPLLISLPDGEKKMAFNRIGSQADLAPTLLTLLGIDAKRYPMLGHDLTKTTIRGPQILFPDGGFVHSPYLYRPRTNRFPSPRCLDIRKGTPISMNHCRQYQSQAKHRKEINDLLLRKDLIPRAWKVLASPSSP